jgi:selenocysteine lyase/cysteine desulfurase
MVVDAIHSAGAVKIDVDKEGVDILTCGCSKWILGPHRTGFLFVRRGLIEASQPSLIGWHSIQNAFDFNLRPLRLSRTATRFEPGNPNFLGFVGARAAIELLLNVGLRSIEKGILGLTGYLIDEVKRLGLALTTPIDLVQRAGIVNFKVRNLAAVMNRLRRKRIAVSSRGGGVRVSPHFYNTIEELDSLLSVLRTK